MKLFEAEEMKSMSRKVIMITVVSYLVIFCGIGGLIYFTIWTLKHFGILG